MKIATITPYASPEKGACSIRVDSLPNALQEGMLVITKKGER